MIKNLYFNIHYCNGGKRRKPANVPYKIERTLQHHELIFICNGNGRFSIGGKRFPLKRGAMLYITPHNRYSIEMDAGEPANFLAVHFSYAKVSFNDGKWNVKNVTQALPLPPVQEFIDPYPVESQLKKLVDSWDSKMPGYEFIARTFLQQLMLVIAQNTEEQNRNYASSQRVKKIIQYMHQNINGKVFINELSGMVRISPAYLSRTFKEATGYTVIEYFTKLKIDKAKEMLLEGNLKVKEVAQSLGFADEFYFSRVFKKLEGMNPSEFSSRNVHAV